MRAWSVWALVALGLGCGGAARPAAGPVRDDRPRIGVVDLLRTLHDSAFGRQSQAALDAHNAERRKELDAGRQAVAQMKEGPERARRAEELRQLAARIENDTSNEASAAADRLRERAKVEAEAIGKRDGYPLIIETNGQLLWRVDGPIPVEDEAVKVDLTDEMIRRLPAP